MAAWWESTPARTDKDTVSRPVRLRPMVPVDEAGKNGGSAQMDFH